MFAGERKEGDYRMLNYRLIMREAGLVEMQMLTSDSTAHRIVLLI